MGATWRHSETAGDRVELETRSCFLGVLQQKKNQGCNDYNTTSQAYFMMIKVRSDENTMVTFVLTTIYEQR